MLFFILIRGAICLVVCAFSLSLIDSDCLSHIFQRASWLLPQPRCRLSYAKLGNSIRTTKIFYHVAPTNFPPHPFSDDITPTFGHLIAIRGRPHRGFFGDYPNPKRGRSFTRRQGSARYEEGSHIASFRCVPPFIFSILRCAQPAVFVGQVWKLFCLLPSNDSLLRPNDGLLPSNNGLLPANETQKPCSA